MAPREGLQHATKKKCAITCMHICAEGAKTFSRFSFKKIPTPIINSICLKSLYVRPRGVYNPPIPLRTTNDCAYMITDRCKADNFSLRINRTRIASRKKCGFGWDQILYIVERYWIRLSVAHGLTKSNGRQAMTKQKIRFITFWRAIGYRLRCLSLLEILARLHSTLLRIYFTSMRIRAFTLELA